MSEYKLEQVRNGDYRYCLGAILDCKSRPENYLRIRYSIYVISEYIALKKQSSFSKADLIFEMYKLQAIICNSNKSENPEFFFNLFKIRDYAYYELSLSRYCLEKEYNDIDIQFLDLLSNAREECVPRGYQSKYLIKT